MAGLLSKLIVGHEMDKYRHLLHLVISLNNKINKTLLDNCFKDRRKKHPLHIITLYNNLKIPFFFVYSTYSNHFFFFPVLRILYKKKHTFYNGSPGPRFEQS